MKNISDQKSHAVLLYYCYATISDPEAYREQHHLFCIEHQLLGRIIIAHEGLNGTVSGTVENCEAYIKFIHDDQRFADTEFKVHYTDHHAFAKLHVRYKREIVYSGLRHINPRIKTGKYIEPSEFKTILKNKPDDVVILDVRSDYEYGIGRFKDAVTLDIENFRDFPEKIAELEELKNKKVITYCTGGIKCEKASAFLLEQGFQNVYQLHGGIIKYGLETDGENFEGKCYVFDNRITTEINKSNPTIISKCYITGVPTDRMVNCANPHCNLHIPMSIEGGIKFNGCCSESCMNHPDTRPYDGSGYYQKKLNGYNPKKGLKRNNSCVS